MAIRECGNVTTVLTNLERPNGRVPGSGVDLGNESAGVVPVDCNDRFWHRAEPAAIRRKSVRADRFTPGSIVVAGVMQCALLFEYNPGVNRKDAPPPHSPGSIYPNERLGMAGCRRQKSGA